jgi:hypothetical protein
MLITPLEHGLNLKLSSAFHLLPEDKKPIIARMLQ